MDHNFRFIVRRERAVLQKNRGKKAQNEINCLVKFRRIRNMTMVLKTRRIFESATIIMKKQILKMYFCKV